MNQKARTKREPTTTYSFRVPETLHSRYVKHCHRTLKRDGADVAREMFQALVEGRLTIKPSEAQETLYQTNNEEQ